MIRITENLSIAEDEMSFTFSRSPGPGGQNVNKSATKATLRFNVADSRSLSPSQRGRIFKELATRIGRDGVLRVAGWRHRTQGANRRDILERFIDLVAEALRPKTPRKKTKPTRAARERRLRSKQHRSGLKQSRRMRFTSDDA